MREIAVLGSSVRLVVVQFLVKNHLVPDWIERREANPAPLSPVPGVEVFESTPSLDVFPLVSKVDAGGDYELVDAWAKPHATNRNMSFIRFVYCRKEYVDEGGIHPEFREKRGMLEELLVDFTNNNLWATEMHLNPYLEKDGRLADCQSVLMVGCAGRRINGWVYKGGHDRYGQGIGPKVMLSTLVYRLNLVDRKMVALEDPAS